MHEHRIARELELARRGIAPRVNLHGQNYGRSLTVAVGKKATLIRLEEEDEKARVVTVTLVVLDDQPSVLGPGGVVGWPFATLLWGNGGLQAKAEVDFVDGLVLSIPAGFLQIDANNPSDGFGPVKLGAFLVLEGVVPKVTTSVRSFLVPAIVAAGSSAVVFVPTLADNCTFERTPTEAFRLDFLDRNGNVVYSEDVAPGLRMDPVDIAAGVEGVIVVNTSFSGIAAGRMMFGLDL